LKNHLNAKNAMRGSKRKNIYASIRLKHILTESDLSKVS
jgi:hypothetical protein